jgi:hypothetical protein
VNQIRPNVTDEEILRLAKAVLVAGKALNLDMGDGEATYQCCRAVCGHPPSCPIGDALLIAERLTKLDADDIAGLNESRQAENQAPVFVNKALAVDVGTRIRVIARWSSFRGCEGVVVQPLPGGALIRLDPPEHSELRFGLESLELV